MNEIVSVPKAEPIKADRSRQTVITSPEYAEFLPAAMELSMGPPPRIVPVLIGTIMAAIVVALIWSSLAWLDVFTSAAGRVRSTETAGVVQSLEAGRVTKILTSNGAAVKAGDILVRLDEVSVATALDAASAGRSSWIAEVERRAAAYRSVASGSRDLPEVQFDETIPANVKRRETEALSTEFKALMSAVSAKRTEEQEVEARYQRFTEVQAVKQRLMDILSQRVHMQENLKSSGAGSSAELLSMLDAQARVEADLADTSAQLVEIAASIRNLKEQQTQAIAGFLSEQSKGIQTAERQVEQLDQEIRKQQDRMDHLALRAPIDGTVQQLAVTSPGQIVNTGQPLMVVVPARAKLIVEALVPSAEIGFVSEGDEVVVKADAFPFTRYGTFAGSVTSISDEAVTIGDAQGLQDPATIASGKSTNMSNGIPTVNGLFYIARIDLENDELRAGAHALKLEAGMTVRAEIKTDSRRVIDYVLSPVKEVLAESGHEK